MEKITLLQISAAVLTGTSSIPSLGHWYKRTVAVLLVLILLAVWMSTGFPPFINGKTSTLFFGSILFLRSFFNLGDKTSFYARISAAIMITCGLFIPVSSQKIDAVLASFWLGIHVPFFFLGYLSLTIAFISSFTGDKQTEKREAMLSGLFLFLGLFTGAIWAEISWGRFFGFDPKEVWTLSLILSLSSYFFTDKISHRKTILRISFFLMLATYLVVSFILPGMHSYV
jgi:ABC-type transport system involved in cytochrome c biogenesis permease subunit